MSDHDAAVVVWLNPEVPNRPQKRLLETLTAPDSLVPLAFPIRSLRLTVTSARVAASSTLQDLILTSTKENPILVPVSLARSELGWTEFDFITPEEA